jgi:diadenylate cyclase
MELFQSILSEILVYLRFGLEIAILSFGIYSALLFVRGTRGATILAGITSLTIMLNLISRSFGLEVIEWLLMKMWTFLALSVLIVFQPEIRRALAELGSKQTRLRMRMPSKQNRVVTERLLDSTFFLASRRIGALIAIERDIGMRSIAETGTPINSPLTKELLTTFFFPNTPLHDGGTIIRGEMIVAAGCIFPLTDDPDMSKSLGTRHRAGVGITEETDAVAIIVSEETGSVSLAFRGRLIRGINRNRLERHLKNFFMKSGTQKGVRAGLSELRSSMDNDNMLDEESV